MNNSPACFVAAGALSLFQVSLEYSETAAKYRDIAVRLLSSAAEEIRKGLGDIYTRFLNSQVLLSRVERKNDRIRVLELISKCQTPLEEKTEEEKRLCGTTVTSEIDRDEFIAKSLVAVNMAISSPADDIGMHYLGQETKAFHALEGFASGKRKRNVERIAQIAIETCV